MEELTVQELLQAVQGSLVGPYANGEARVSQVDTDSRSVHPGSLFVPLVGERFDGHTYLSAALKGGSLGCLVHRPLESYREDRFYIQVEDTQRALGALASWYRDKLGLPCIGVTGSVGKTTAKDMIGAVLSVKYPVCKTEGNFNNQIGLPLTLLQMDSSHEVGVLEMGMDSLGEIDYLGRLVKPTVGVITNIDDAHIEKLGSREKIFQAKCELIPHISRQNGLLLLNGDDPMLASLEGKTPVPTLFFGRGAHCAYRARMDGGDGMSHIHCQIQTPRGSWRARVPALGEHMLYPTLIAVAIGEYFGLTEQEIQEGITQFVPTKMRMNLLRRGEGITILDDTYNANPQSMRAAIRVLAESRSQWKVAILGDMFELGPYAPALHQGVGESLGKEGIDCLLAVGTLSEHIAEEARRQGVSQVYYCTTKGEAKRLLPQLLRPQSTILVKASRGMALEELTQELIHQTREWNPGNVAEQRECGKTL